MLTTSLGYRGYTIQKNQLAEDEISKIRKELTVVPFVAGDYAGPNNKPQPYKIFKESSTKLYLPKFYGLAAFGKPQTIKRYAGDDIDNNLKFVGDLRKEQKAPVEAILDACHDPNRMGGILNLTCASGKTVLAIYCIVQLKKKALIVVHKDFLLQQWLERIQQFTTGAKVGYIKGKIIDVENKNIVIASLQSLAMKEYDESVFQGFGTVIYDEVHHCSAEVFCRALSKTVCSYTIGLTATIKRKDGLTKVFIWHLGDVAYSNVKNIKHDTVHVHLHKYSNDTQDYCKEVFMYGDKLNVSRMINNICDFQPRTIFMVDIIQQLLIDEPKRKILVLSDRRNHLHAIAAELANRKGIPKFGYYYGGIKESELKEAENNPILLGTYAYVSEGFDKKGLDTLVLASPKSDIVQVVGRILRDKPEDRIHTPMVIDVIDNFSLFVNQAKKRSAYYKKCKYNVISSDQDNVCDEQCNKVVIPKGYCMIDDDM